MKYYIYKTTCLITGKSYVGQRAKYKEADNHYFGSGRLIRQEIKKYGEENFVKEILFDEVISVEYANKLETEMIQKHNTLFPNGYNLLKVGFSRGSTASLNSPNYKPTYVPWNKGKIMSKEYRQKLSNALKRDNKKIKIKDLLTSRVYCFSSYSEASDTLNCSKGVLSDLVNGRKKIIFNRYKIVKHGIPNI